MTWDGKWFVRQFAVNSSNLHPHMATEAATFCQWGLCCITPILFRSPSRPIRQGATFANKQWEGLTGRRTILHKIKLYPLPGIQRLFEQSLPKSTRTAAAGPRRICSQKQGQQPHQKHSNLPLRRRRPFHCQVNFHCGQIKILIFSDLRLTLEKCNLSTEALATKSSIRRNNSNTTTPKSSWNAEDLAECWHILQENERARRRRFSSEDLFKELANSRELALQRMAIHRRMIEFIGDEIERIQRRTGATQVHTR